MQYLATKVAGFGEIFIPGAKISTHTVHIRTCIALYYIVNIFSHMTLCTGIPEAS